MSLALEKRIAAERVRLGWEPIIDLALVTLFIWCLMAYLVVLIAWELVTR